LGHHVRYVAMTDVCLFTDTDGQLMGDQASLFEKSIRKDATHYQVHCPPNTPVLIGNRWTELMNKIREGDYRGKNITVSKLPSVT